MTYRASDRDRDGDLDRVSLTAAVDRVRWASILAGLFTVLASLAFFTILGIALGLSTFDPNNLENFGAGAGIYGVVAAVLSFGLGGFIASRTAAVVGTGNAILNGAMVWIVVVPIFINVVTAGIGSLLGTAINVTGSAIGTAVDVASNVAGDVADEASGAVSGAATQVAENPELQATAEAAVTEAVEQASTAVAGVQQQIDEPEEQQAIARDLSRPAWGLLLAFGLTALASILGGLAGRRTLPTDVAVVNEQR